MFGYLFSVKNEYKNFRKDRNEEVERRKGRVRKARTAGRVKDRKERRQEVRWKGRTEGKNEGRKDRGKYL